MARYVLILLVALASGCVRIHFDLCAEDPPHDECLDGSIDAGPDASMDGGDAGG